MQIPSYDRFLVMDAEGYPLASCDSLIDALNAGRHWKHLIPPNGPTSGIYVIDKEAVLQPINIP